MEGVIVAGWGHERADRLVLGQERGLGLEGYFSSWPGMFQLCPPVEERNCCSANPLGVTIDGTIADE
eukprot:10666052-Ditylum_brightwellii.AAC.1